MRQEKTEPALVGIYREGLAAAAVLVITGPTANRILVADHQGEAVLGPGEAIHQRWWCRRQAEAEYLAETAARSLRRAREASDRTVLACTCILRAAERLAIPLQSDQDLREEALRVIARLDLEIEKQQRSGVLKSVNTAYRQYRLDASARGERTMRYAEWMERYKTDLLREIAANLRSF